MFLSMCYGEGKKKHRWAYSEHTSLQTHQSGLIAVLLSSHIGLSGTWGHFVPLPFPSNLGRWPQHASLPKHCKKLSITVPFFKHWHNLFASLIAASYWADKFTESFTLTFHFFPELCSQLICDWLKWFPPLHVTEHLAIVPPVIMVPKPLLSLCTWKSFAVFSSVMDFTKHF